MENKQSQNGNIMSDNRGRGLFYGVIAIATFIIMAVGATFAYFTATTSSMNAAVKTGSTTLQLQYISYGSAWMNEDLIPADTNIVEYSFENQSDITIKTVADTGAPEVKRNNALCKDDFGNSICSAYVFQVTNSANSPQSVSLNVVSEVNEFASLNAMAYEVSILEDRTDYDSTENNNGVSDPVFRANSEDETGIDVVDGEGAILYTPNYTPVFINRNGIKKKLLSYVESRDISAGTTVVRPAIDRLLVPITDLNVDSAAADRTAKIADDIEIGSNETKTFALILYIKNSNEDQTDTDAAKSFSGQVVVSSGDGSTGVSGTISAVTGDTTLQSNSTPTSE